MTLTHAQRCAEKLLLWLMPYCERIAVAGSIRRERLHPADIDLVCLPKELVEADLFGKVVRRTNLVQSEVMRRITAERWVLEKSGEAYMVWHAKGIQVDLWFCRRETWGTVFMCRTGSREHNIWLAEMAKASGGHWNPHRGLTLPSTTGTVGDTEEAIYAALGLPYVEPADRELPHLSGLRPHAVTG
jgi:DNA polymerase (family 10)